MRDVLVLSQQDSTPQVECQDAEFGICVCGWANDASCLIRESDESTCWACCCQAMAPESYEHAEFPDISVPTPAPEPRHVAVGEGFEADEVVKVEDKCAYVEGYVGESSYVVRFVVTGELLAVKETKMEREPTCIDVFPTETKTTTTRTATRTTTTMTTTETQGMVAMLRALEVRTAAIPLFLILCCCLCAAAVVMRRRRREDLQAEFMEEKQFETEDSEELERAEAEAAAAEEPKADRSCTTWAPDWPSWPGWLSWGASADD